MVITRFAPSPTGYLHLGHAFAALFAAAAGERLMLRIEDIDVGRCRAEFDTAIRDDLRWLGVGFAEPVLRQSQRFAAYRDALARLSARGLVYPCFCTRKDILDAASAPHNQAQGPDGPTYPGICRDLSDAERRTRIDAGKPYALRLDAAKAAAAVGDLWFDESGAGSNVEPGRIKVDPLWFGDVVLARKDAPASYHLAVVLDDAYQGVNLITRGCDLFAASHIQRVLQALLDLPVPAYRHHRLILDDTGKKFSKRDAAATLRTMRNSGITANEIKKRLGF
jgi:glutamyl-Q tRNA(Asp) synthetase